MSQEAAGTAAAPLEVTKVAALSTAVGVLPDAALAEVIAAVPTTADFNITAIEEGLSAQEVADFRRAQLEGLRISKSKHEGEIIANWKLGQKIDQMMQIVELRNGGKRNASAAAHCAQVFGLIEKTVTDYRRFAVMVGSKEQVMALLKYGPSWGVLRHYLQNDTDAKQAEAKKWMIRDNRFISSGDLARINDAVRAEKEKGVENPDYVEVSNAVFEARAVVIAEREKKKEDALNAKLGTPASPEPVSAGDEKAGDDGGVREVGATVGSDGAATSVPASGSNSAKPKAPKDAADLVSTGKLVKGLENQLADINGSLAVLVSRMFKVNGMDDDKAHAKLVNLVEDKLTGPLSQAKEQILAVEKMLDDMKVKG